MNYVLSKNNLQKKNKITGYKTKQKIHSVMFLFCYISILNMEQKRNEDISLY